MAENTSGMATTTLVYGNVEIVVYRPILTEEERKKREAVVHRMIYLFATKAAVSFAMTSSSLVGIT